jgi:hypothetical protein
MYSHRRLAVLIAAVGLLGLAAAANATPLSPFIDLQEKGLTFTSAGKGLMGWGGSPQNLTVNIGGPVRFALLYWAGRERPCVESSPGSGVCPVVAEPFKDQQITFNGTPINGTIIGTESQPQSGGGPILNIGYFADVTSIVAAAGTGSKSFAFGDGNGSSNLWRLDGASLVVAYTNTADPATYRVILWDGLDFAYGADPVPGDTRTCAAANLDHGINLSARNASLLIVAGDGTSDRPDRIDISNNPSLIDTIDGSQGGQWDSNEYPITIPAGVGITTVQPFSEPANQNPNSLLWEVVALRVQQLDIAAPLCPLRVVQGPPTQVFVNVRDAQTGLASVVVTKSENADTVIPPFTPGTTDIVTATSTKIDQSQRSRVEMVVADLAGNRAVCDPILATLAADNAQEGQETYSDVPQAESKVTVTNGNPGIKKVEVTANGKKFKLNGLKDGETQTLDIASALHAGDNTVTVKVNGPRGATVNVVIWDGAGEIGQ